MSKISIFLSEFFVVINFRREAHLWIEGHVDVSVSSRQIATALRWVRCVGQVKAFSRDQLVAFELEQHLICI